MREPDFAKFFGHKLKALRLQRKDEQGILSFHSIRHTYNTMLAELGADSGTRMMLLGHSTLSINKLLEIFKASLQFQQCMKLFTLLAGVTYLREQNFGVILIILTLLMSY